MSILRDQRVPCAVLSVCQQAAVALLLLAVMTVGTAPLRGQSTAETLKVVQQWNVPPNGDSYPLLETYLTNPGQGAVSFGQPQLNGKPVDFLKDGVMWWQYYPSEQCLPGQTVVLQVRFEKQVLTSGTLEIPCQDTSVVRVSHEPSRDQRIMIRDVLFEPGFARIYFSVRNHDPEAELSGLSVNGRDCTRHVKRLQTQGGKRPGVWQVELPFELRPGDPVSLQVTFQDGSAVQTVLRAYSGFFTHAFGVDELDMRLKRELALTPAPFSRLIDVDVACIDARERQDAFCARQVSEERLKRFKAGEPFLTHLHLCTAASGNVDYRMYPGLTDAVQVNPYRLAWSDAERVVDEEAKRMRWAHDRCRPRPCFWIAEAFTHKDRMLEPQELRLMTSAAIGQGLKGISYFICTDIGPVKGFRNSLRLKKEIVALNREFQKLERVLAVALPLETRFFDGQSREVPAYVRGVFNTEQKFCAYVLMCRGEGLLVVLRNMDTADTDRSSNRMGETPLFRYQKQNNLKLSIDLPDSMRSAKRLTARDPRDGTSFEVSVQDGKADLRVPELDLTRIIHIQTE